MDTEISDLAPIRNVPLLAQWRPLQINLLKTVQIDAIKLHLNIKVCNEQPAPTTACR